MGAKLCICAALSMAALSSSVSAAPQVQALPTTCTNPTTAGKSCFSSALVQGSVGDVYICSDHWNVKADGQVVFNNPPACSAASSTGSTDSSQSISPPFTVTVPQGALPVDRGAAVWDLRWGGGHGVVKACVFPEYASPSVASLQCGPDSANLW